MHAYEHASVHDVILLFSITFFEFGTKWPDKLLAFCVVAPLFSLCSGHRRYVCPMKCRMEKGVAKTVIKIFNVGPF